MRARKGRWNCEYREMASPGRGVVYACGRSVRFRERRGEAALVVDEGSFPKPRSRSSGLAPRPESSPAGRKIVGGTIAPLGLALAVLMAAASSPAQQAYPLVCRGGGDMRLEILYQAYEPAISGRFSGILIRFRGADAGAATRQPLRGECAWLDRGFRPGEVGDRPLRFPLGPGIERVVVTDRGIELRFRADASGERLRALVEAVQRGRIFYLHAYRENGYFFVTRLGP